MMHELSLIGDLATASSSIDTLERALLEMPQAPIKTAHRFLPGLYERTITIPPWTVLTGAEHLTDYRVRIERGTIAVTTDDGVKMLVGPCEFNSRAGTRRVGRVLGEEVVWIDIYNNEDNGTDITAIESRIYAVPTCGLGENRVGADIARDRKDFEKFMGQIGLSQQEMDEIVKIEHDLIPMPDGYGVELRDSQIHGTGLFALREFETGQVICPGRLSGKRTPAGRFINHSLVPNTTAVKEGDDIWACALKKIQVNEEILIDYRMSMRVNFGLTIEGEMPCQVG